MKHNSHKRKPIDFLGFRVEYSDFQRRWFVSDYDYEIGWRDIGPSHPTKEAAFRWIEGQSY